MATTNAPDGTTIDYEDSGGDGTAVVLVHGITESRESLRPMIDRLRADGHRTVALDLRGHGMSGDAADYGFEHMATDVIAVIEATGVARPHLIGHSLGGVVVSAVGATTPVASVVNIDQALQLGAFKESLTPVESMLRDPASFGAVMAGLFEQLVGKRIAASESERLAELRRPEQEVVLGVWEAIFSNTAAQANAIVEAALAGYAAAPVPYLSLFGADPGPDYAPWISSQIPGAVTELWANHGHYPHLVDLDRCITRLESFWAATEPA